MIPKSPVRKHRTLSRTLTLGFAALLGGSLLASQVSAVVICQKERNGKLSFKLREACRTDKGETEAPIGTRTQVFHTFTDSQQAISGDDIALPVDGASTSFSFETTSESSDVVIAFTAGCHTNDTTGGGWLDVDLVLDGTTVAPTDLPRNGFCIVVGASPEEVEQTNSYTVAVENVPAGSHSVQALASNVSVTPFAFMGDVSLVVTVHEN
jgi:hypothetical protein